MEGFYGHPRHGGNKDRVGWQALGYPGPSFPHGNEPLTAGTTPTSPTSSRRTGRIGRPDILPPLPLGVGRGEGIAARRKQMAKHETVDVCIIGGGASGAGGGQGAHAAGMTVCVLERGPWYKREDFAWGTSSPTSGATSSGPRWSSSRARGGPTPTRRPRSCPPRPRPSPTPCAWAAGTIHYSGLSWRFHESDFRVKSEDGPVAGTTIEDWPISYDDMGALLRKGGVDRRHLGEGLVEPLRSAAPA